jgi:hypothetical protein
MTAPLGWVMPRDVLSRRLAVIVAADVVGYSRLMEADEVGTLEQLANELARCASAIDDNLAEGHALLGTIYLMKKMYDEAVAHGVRAIELEPNAAFASATFAMTLN